MKSRDIEPEVVTPEVAERELGDGEAWDVAGQEWVLRSTHGEMPTLYVHPSHWRLGYGRQLCLETLRRAEERGFSSVVL